MSLCTSYCEEVLTGLYSLFKSFLFNNYVFWVIELSNSISFFIINIKNQFDELSDTIIIGVIGSGVLDALGACNSFSFSKSGICDFFYLTVELF
jgi:hypothetical protein